MNKLKLMWYYISDVLLSSVKRVLVTVLFFVTTVCWVDVGSDIYNEMNSLVFKRFNPKSPTEESDNSNNITIDSRI